MKTSENNAVLYLRMSDPQQDMSVAQQREELKKLAEREGYHIIHEYADEGKSGSKDTHKRTDFLQMLKDAPDRKFSVVLAWDVSRLFRLNSLECAPFANHLRTAGVNVHTVKDGKIDWDSRIGRLMFQMLTEGANDYATSLSVNTLRGRKYIASKGWWAVGKVPFGYDRQYVDGSNNPKQLIKRLDKFKKPRDWHLTLKVNEVEAGVIRLIFKRFTEAHLSLRSLAYELNKDGAPSGGDKWTATLVKLVLTTPAYIGKSYFGCKAHKHQSAHNRAGDNSKDDACPKIVDVSIYEKAQNELNKRGNKSYKTTDFRAGLLSGFVVCDNCGRRMEKRTNHNRGYYTCATGSKIPGTACGQWGVREDDSVKFVLDYLNGHVDRAIRAMAEAKHEKKPESFEDVLRSKVKTLKGQVENGRRNALLASAEDSAEMFKLLEGVKDQLREAEAALIAQATDVSTSDAFQWWEQNKAALVALCEGTGYTLKGKGKGLMTLNPKEANPIVTNVPKFRALLKVLELEVRFRFGPWVGKQPRGGLRKWMVERRSLSVKVGNERKGATEVSQVTEVNNTTGSDYISVRVLL